MNGPAGRIARIVLGVGLIGWGYTLRSTGAGLVLMAFGLVPLATGVFNWCVISALLGGSLRSTRPSR